jgi:hypothetical protein
MMGRKGKKKERRKYLPPLHGLGCGFIYQILSLRCKNIAIPVHCVVV